MPDGTSLTGDAQRGTTDAQFKASSTSGEARVYSEIGPDGKSVVKGGAQGMGEGEVDSAMYDHDVGRQGQDKLHVEKLQQRDAATELRGSAAGEAGYRDPASEAARARQLELNQQDAALGRVDSAQDTGAEAQRAYDDPSGTATRTGKDAGMAQVNERAPVGETRANAKVATETIRDPAQAGEARAEAEVDVEVRGVDPTKKK
ncbi:MAG TPA: hypothetical protein VIV40_31465 [Kofleriaceae bacterium]